MNKITTGARVKNLRIENNLSQLELSQKIGSGKSYLSMVELDNRTLNTHYLVELSKVFNVTTDYLLCLTDIKNIYSDIEREKSENINTIFFNNFIESLLKTKNINTSSDIDDDTMSFINQAFKMQIDLKKDSTKK